MNKPLRPGPAGFFEKLQSHQQAATVDQILHTLEADLKENAELLRQQGQEVERDKHQKAEDQKRDNYERNGKDIVDDRLVHLLGFAAVAAQANDSSAVTVPSFGMWVPGAAALLGGIQQDVIEGITDSPNHQARQRALWALSNGALPHPGDLQTILAQFQKQRLDVEYRLAFKGLSERLDQLDTARPAVGQLKGTIAHVRLEAFKHCADYYREYGGERLSKLVCEPETLIGTASPKLPPPRATTIGGMSTRELDLLLNRFTERSPA